VLCDFDRRIEFCERMMLNIDRNLLFTVNIIFSDEVTFELTGNINRHNANIGAMKISIRCTRHIFRSNKKSTAEILNEAIIGLSLLKVM